MKTSIHTLRAAALAALIVAAASPASAQAWRAGSAADAPRAREAATIVWTGREVIVWGGRIADAAVDRPVDRPVDTGAVYDPAADRWRETARSGAPSPRVWHTAVWTGREMIVWGGDGAEGELASGAAYDPRTDTWRGIAREGAPAARGSHVAVWTGAEMIVWAGVTESNSFATGGRYDPAHDRWTPIRCPFDVPLPRTTTAVWTGREMLVWGGINGGFVLGHGVRYDPATDEWREIAAADAPAARAGHVAAWTGSELLISGGRDRITGGRPLAGGARYSPADDRWSALPAMPLARDEPAAAWTGGELVVLGGRTDPESAAAAGAGARLDPAKGEWRAVAAPADARVQWLARTASGFIACGESADPDPAAPGRVRVWIGEGVDPVADPVADRGEAAEGADPLAAAVGRADLIAVVTARDTLRYRGQGGGTIAMLELRIVRLLAGEERSPAVHAALQLTSHDSQAPFEHPAPGEGESLILLARRRVAEGDVWYDPALPTARCWWPASSDEARRVEALLAARR